MGSVWQMVDPDDFDSVRFDCNDGTNCTVAGGARLGVARRSSDLLSPANRDGDRESSGKYGRKVALVPMNLKATTADGLVTLARALGTELRRGGVMKFRAEDATELEFYDFYSCDVPDLYNNELPFFHASTGIGGTYSATVIVELPHHPTPRLALVEGTPTALDNSSGGGALFVNNPGNVAGETITSIVPDANLGGFILGIRDKGNLTEFAELYSRDATTFTDLSSDSALDVDKIVTDFADASFHKLYRSQRPVVDPTAAEGSFRAILTYQQEGGTSDNESKFRLQMRFAFADTEILQGVRERIEVDWRDVVNDGKAYVDLGLIDVPAGVDTIIIDVWGKRLSGDHELACFKIDLIPADTHFLVGSTFRKGEWGRLVWDHDELTGDGDIRKSRYRLNEQNEVAHTDPQPFVPGIHRGRVEFSIHEPEDDSITSGPNPTEKEIARFRLVEDPTYIGTVRARRKLFNRKNVQVLEKGTRTVLAEVDGGDAGVDFWWEVEQTAATLDGRKVFVHEIVHSFLPAIASTDTLVLDAMTSESNVESSTATAFTFLVESRLPLAPPGDSVWVFLFFGLPTDQGFEEIHPEGNSPLAGRAGLATASLSANVQVDVVPRVTH